MYDKKEIGKRIEILRKNKLHGMSQRRLGKAIGMTGQNIGLVINGKSSLSLENAIKLCEYADTSMDYLFRGIDLSEHINSSVLLSIVRHHNLKLAENNKEESY